MSKHGSLKKSIRPTNAQDEKPAENEQDETPAENEQTENEQSSEERQQRLVDLIIDFATMEMAKKLLGNVCYPLERVFAHWRRGEKYDLQRIMKIVSKRSNWDLVDQIEKFRTDIRSELTK